MDPTKMWDYRVVRKESEDGSDEWYSVQEVYYDGDGSPMAQTIDLQVEGDTITELRTQLEKMINCLGQPVLDESDILDMPVVETNPPLPQGTLYHTSGMKIDRKDNKDV